MMRIKKIRFIDEVRNDYNFTVLMLGLNLKMIIRIPNDLMEKRLKKKINFLQPGTPMGVVKKLTKDIVTEAIKTYAKGKGYWLKLF